MQVNVTLSFASVDEMLAHFGSAGATVMAPIPGKSPVQIAAADIATLANPPKPRGRPSKAKVEAWTDTILDYLRGRSNLARVYVLIDGRHGVKDVDRDVLNLLDSAAVSYAIVMTKLDEVKKADVQNMLDGVKLEIAKRPAAYPHIVFTSSRTGEGIPDLRAAVAQLLAERHQGT
jgi:selenocysteine-specific translation elongation factor